MGAVRWSQPISTRKIDVYWWADGAGVRLPKACRREVLGRQGFVPVGNPSGLGVAGKQFNATTFDEVRTSKLRLEMDSDGDVFHRHPGMAGLRLGQIAQLPARRDRRGGSRRGAGRQDLPQRQRQSLQAATPDRPAFTGARLRARARSLSRTPRPVTTARFSEAGDYVLKLTAGEGELSAVGHREGQGRSSAAGTRTGCRLHQDFQGQQPALEQPVKALIVDWIPHCIDEINDTEPAQGQGGIDNFVEAGQSAGGRAARTAQRLSSSPTPGSTRPSRRCASR